MSRSAFFNVVIGVFVATTLRWPEVECNLSYQIVGKADRTTKAGVNYAGTAFLLQQNFTHNCVVFAFKGSYRNLNPARFQIWRPSQPGTNSYRLITEVIHRSESERRSLPALETFYLVTDLQSTNDKKCLRVQSGDRVGLYFEHNVSALSYHFTTDRSNVRTMAHLFRNASLPVAGSNEDVRFYNIIYPYHFLAAAYCYQDSTTSSSPVDVTCDRSADTAVADDRPKPTTPPPQPGATGETGNTGPPGFTGSTGIRGQIGPKGAPGDTGQTGAMGYTGATGSTGQHGPLGDTGSAGMTGDTGYTGSTGDAGDTGFTGTQGDTGPAGVVAYVNDTNSFNDSYAAYAEENMWKTEEFMFGAIIWLAALTLIVIVFIVILIILSCIQCNRRRQLYSQINTTNARREKPDGVDGMEMKATGSVDESLDDNAVDEVDDANNATWMTSLPEISTLEYSPSSNTAALTFGPFAGKQAAAELQSTFADDNENDMPPPPPDTDEPDR